MLEAELIESTPLHIVQSELENVGLMMCKKLTCDRSVICNLVQIAPVPDNSDSARTKRRSDNTLMNTITWHQAWTRDQEIWLLLTQIPCPLSNNNSK